MSTIGPLDGSAEYVKWSIEGLAGAPRHRLRRPLLPAPRRPERPDRGDGRRDGRAGRAGQDPPHRAERGRAGDDPPRARRAPDHALQTEYSLWTRDLEAEILPTCRELGIGFVPYSPLGRGFLSGRFKSPDDLDENDFRRHGPRFTGENLDANLKLAAKVEEIAEGKGITPAQLAIAWVLAQGEDIVPIPGTKRRKYLEQNAAAVDVELTDDDLARIDAELPKAGRRPLRRGGHGVGQPSRRASPTGSASSRSGPPRRLGGSAPRRPGYAIGGLVAFLALLRHDRLLRRLRDILAGRRGCAESHWRDQDHLDPADLDGRRRVPAPTSSSLTPLCSDCQSWEKRLRAEPEPLLTIDAQGAPEPARIRDRDRPHRASQSSARTAQCSSGSAP